MAASENGVATGLPRRRGHLRVGCAAAMTTEPGDRDGQERDAPSGEQREPGRTAPASAAPAGTPVCLIENVSAMRSGGVVRVSTSDEAAVIGP